MIQNTLYTICPAILGRAMIKYQILYFSDFEII